MSRSLVAVALAAVAGCGAEGADVGQLQAALSAATPAPYAPVGWLVASERVRYDPLVGDCTATLIGARTILAAGHCQQRNARYVFHLWDRDGRRRSYDAERLRTPASYALITLPDGRGQTTVDDIALLTLRKTPALERPRASLSGRELSELATSLGSSPLDAYAVGVGPERTGDAMRRPQRTAVPLPEAADIAARHAADELWLPVAPGGGHFVRGDSGGPTIVHLDPPQPGAAVDDGRWVVVGVHSRYRVRDEVNVDMPLRRFMAWIRASAAGDLCEETAGPAGVRCSACGAGGCPPAAAAPALPGKADDGDAERAQAGGCTLAPAVGPGLPLSLLCVLAALRRRRRGAWRAGLAARLPELPSAPHRRAARRDARWKNDALAERCAAESAGPRLALAPRCWDRKSRGWIGRAIRM